jgi:hypothetical protein
LIVFSPLGSGVLIASSLVSQGRYLDAVKVALACMAISIIFAVTYAIVYWLLNLSRFKQ